MVKILLILLLTITAVNADRYSLIRNEDDAIIRYAEEWGAEDPRVKYASKFGPSESHRYVPYVVDDVEPVYDTATHRIERTDVVDATTHTYTWQIIALTAAEIQYRADVQERDDFFSDFSGAKTVLEAAFSNLQGGSNWDDFTPAQRNDIMRAILAYILYQSHTTNNP